MGNVSAALKKKSQFDWKRDKTVANPPLSFSSILQASRGTVKASGNFNAGADAEVLYKAMKGLGKMLTCVCCQHSVIWYMEGVSVSSTAPTDQGASFLGGVPSLN